MSEYIVRWDGIGAQLIDMLNSHVPPHLWAKRIREERRLERIVRCRDCRWHREIGDEHVCIENAVFHRKTWAYGYCDRGERREE